jgi:hypothetical protein
MLVVPDATKDPRFYSNPLVTGLKRVPAFFWTSFSAFAPTTTTTTTYDSYCYWPHMGNGVCPDALTHAHRAALDPILLRRPSRHQGEFYCEISFGESKRWSIKRSNLAISFFFFLLIVFPFFATLLIRLRNWLLGANHRCLKRLTRLFQGGVRVRHPLRYRSQAAPADPTGLSPLSSPHSRNVFVQLHPPTHPPPSTPLITHHTHFSSWHYEKRKSL